MMKRQPCLLVLAPTAFTWRRIRELPDARRYAFQPLLAYQDLFSNRAKPFHQLLDEARSVVRSLPHVDGILSMWDFPATALSACLSREFGLRGPTLESLLRCEHKYWARCLQREAVPAIVPPFQRVDLSDENQPLPLEPPFWLKPVKSASSALGFRIDSPDDFQPALGKMRSSIRRYTDPFAEALAHATLPDDIARLGADYAVAEGMLSGRQAALEGYVRHGKACFRGIVDTIHHSNHCTFSRYAYPSRLDAKVVERMQDAATLVLERIGYNNAAFHAEFFYDEQRDEIGLLGINPRLSQSHSKLFQLVDGSPNLSELISVVLDEEPVPLTGGDYAFAAKLFYRTVLKDAVINALPSRHEIAAIEREIPGVEIVIDLDVGARLSDLPRQESYSYELVHLHIGGNDEGEILQKYQECVDRLVFGFQEIHDDELSSGYHRVSALPQLVHR